MKYSLNHTNGRRVGRINVGMSHLERGNDRGSNGNEYRMLDVEKTRNMTHIV